MQTEPVVDPGRGRPSACSTKGEVGRDSTCTRLGLARLQRKFRGMGGTLTRTRSAERDHRQRNPVPSTTSTASISDAYDLKESLGRGEFATVRRAVQLETGLEVAVKVIRTTSRKASDAASLEYQLSCRLSSSFSASSSHTNKSAARCPPDAADTFPKPTART